MVAIAMIVMDNLACFLRDLFVVAPDWAGVMEEEQWVVADAETNFMWQFGGDL